MYVNRKKLMSNGGLFYMAGPPEQRWGRVRGSSGQTNRNEGLKQTQGQITRSLGIERQRKSINCFFRVCRRICEWRGSRFRSRWGAIQHFVA